METRVMLTMESRIHGDMYVRFGGRLVETYHRKVAKRCWPSLRKSTIKRLGSNYADFEVREFLLHLRNTTNPKRHSRISRLCPFGIGYYASLSGRSFSLQGLSLCRGRDQASFTA